MLFGCVPIVHFLLFVFCSTCDSKHPFQITHGGKKKKEEWENQKKKNVKRYAYPFVQLLFSAADG